MANTHRFREGRQELVKMPVASATVIERGDMVFLGSSAGEVFPASMHNWDGGLATTQGVFAGVFMGIAYEESASGDTDQISIDVCADAIYEFDVASSTYEFGATLGPDESSNTLMDQQLEAATGTSSVARARKKEAAAVTKLLVSFASAYITSSSNVNANIG